MYWENFISIIGGQKVDKKQIIDTMWDDSPVDVSTEVNFIWSIANKLRGTYQSDKYGYYQTF